MAVADSSQAEGPNYPRPQMRRESWICLNGPWRFAFDSLSQYRLPEEVNWTHTIRVPFCPESELSGIGDTSFHAVVWYERDVPLATQPGKRTLLHFSAVDYTSRVWINGHYVGEHEGGFTPFCFDITDYLESGSSNVRIALRAEDDPHDLAKPRGKQDWKLEAHSIWYPRTTGIWQTVWIEQVPETYIARVLWTPHLERWEIGCEAFLEGGCEDGDCELRVTLSANGQVLVRDSYRVIAHEVHRRIALSDPGIDDSRNELLWSPEKPTLIDAEIELIQNGRVIDAVRSYTALRSLTTRRDRVILNGRPYYLRMVLDQGYWQDGLMTAPDPQAHRRDIELIKAMGFNGARKHQKIEDPNYLYWADVLGLLVWVEMPSAYRFTHDGVERIMREWIEVIDRDRNHPSVVVWVPFNESWGVPDLPEKEAHRHCVQALYYLTHTLDPSRPVVGNDGWESTTTDIIGIHDYDNHPTRIFQRYQTSIPLSDLLTQRQPAGRAITLEDYPHEGQPIMLTEFGGIALVREQTTARRAWGYAFSHTESEFLRKYSALLSVVNRIEVFAGFCYTQLTDTFQEANGLLFADRTPKVPLEEIRAATLSQPTQPEEVIAVALQAAARPVPENS